MPAIKKNFLAFSLSCLLLSSCAYLDQLGLGEKKVDGPQKLVLQPAQFSDLPEWNKDQQAQTLIAFAKSCARIVKSDPNKKLSDDLSFGSYADWQEACRNLPKGSWDAASARTYFENHFTPVLATNSGNAEGLFTGYFEASLRGSLTKTATYSIPLRAKPSDLIMVDLGQFREELKGQRIAGRNVSGNLKPYESRAEIEDGKLPDAQDKVLLYVDSAVDAFFLQIQGSGIVALEDGSTRRVGYDGQNGHPYYAIGKELIKRGHLAKGQVSMQSIKEWMAKNPVEAREVMRTNKSYVFFKFTDDGPKGGEGVTLTPNRSLAIDRSLIPYGMPVYLATEKPVYNRLMVAQDTGGAIRGAVRGDIFFGYGAQAEELAGPMNSKGRYWLLLPKHIAPQDKK
ncbi:MAG: murein transglycosylase [Micavibrio aeruginosavorus]|uniref:peptidoglycan lytic exotransglycosylase n=1 Tax=Micavibrio aeruginosavorus TaxID=349221 RepID=A0A2W5FR07_9BACT|nr:MAG: murein transglycosylase [Micavibrio aeruginosavorus]